MTVASGHSVPRLLEAAALLAEVPDEVACRPTWRGPSVPTGRGGRRPAGASRLPETIHHGIASGVYAGLGAGLRVAARGLDALAARDVGPALEDSRHGRFVAGAINKLIGDRLARNRPRLAVPLAVRRHGRDVPLHRDALGQAFSAASGARGGAPARAR